MSIVAWIILGIVAGFAARTLVPGRDSQGLIITLVLGVCGALLGGFIATELFHVKGIQGFFNLSTWVCAIAGAVVLLLVFNLLNGRRSGRRIGRR